MESNEEKSQPTKDEKLSYDQVSEEWNLPKPTLYAWVHRRQIPFIRMGKRLVRFSRRSIEQWVQERSVAPKAP